MRHFTLSLLLLFTIFSCQKDPLTRPAKVYLDFGIIAAGAEDDLKSADHSNETSSPPFLVIDKGYLTINTIEFEGRRNDASDIFFSASYQPLIFADLHQGTINQQVRYDIPQGVYHRIEMVFHLGGPQEIPLVLLGTTNKNGQSHPIRFEYEFREAVKAVAKPKQGQQIVIREDSSSRMKVDIDADFLFRLINPGMVNNASLINIDGEPTLLINSSTNPNIFNMISARISQAFQIIIE